MRRNQKVGDNGCLFWLVAPIVGIILLAGGIGWLVNNNLLEPVCLGTFVFCCLVGVFYIIRASRKHNRLKQREQNYQNLVQTNMAKWQEWNKDNIPSVPAGKVYLEANEKLLFSAPFKLKVGAGNRINEGTLNLTNLRLIFSSRTSTKKQDYADIFSVEVEQGVMYIKPKKDGKNLCFQADTGREEQNRIALAEAYVIWFLLNTGVFLEAELTVLQILGVQKQEEK